MIGEFEHRTLRILCKLYRNRIRTWLCDAQFRITTKHIQLRKHRHRCLSTYMVDEPYIVSHVLHLYDHWHSICIDNGVVECYCLNLLRSSDEYLHHQ